MHARRMYRGNTCLLYRLFVKRKSKDGVAVKNVNCHVTRKTLLLLNGWFLINGSIKQPRTRKIYLMKDDVKKYLPTHKL